MTQDHGHEHDRDHGEAGGELAVDHVVAVDRLREEPRQRALVALAVDRVEREGDARAAAPTIAEPDRSTARGSGRACRAQPEQARKIAGDRAGVRPAAVRICSAAKYSGISAAMPRTTSRT